MTGKKCRVKLIELNPQSHRLSTLQGNLFIFNSPTSHRWLLVVTLVASRLLALSVVFMKYAGFKDFTSASWVVQWCLQLSQHLASKATVLTEATCDQPKQPKGGFWCSKVPLCTQFQSSNYLSGKTDYSHSDQTSGCQMITDWSVRLCDWNLYATLKIN